MIKQAQLASAIFIGTLTLLNGPAVAWKSDCVLGSGSAVTTHQASSFEIVILYDNRGILDSMGFYLGPDTPHKKENINKVNVLVDSEALYYIDCTVTNIPVLCSVDRDARPHVLDSLDSFMKRGRTLIIPGAGTASLIGYTDASTQAANFQQDSQQ